MNVVHVRNQKHELTPPRNRVQLICAGGTLVDKPPRESLEILDKLAQNDYQHPTSRRGITKRGPTQLDSSDTILAQISALTNMTLESSCYVGNYNKNTMSNTYNPAWRNHPNFSWKNQNNALNPQQPNQSGFQNQPRQNPQQIQPRQEYQQPNDYKNLENTLTQFMAQTSTYMARIDRFIQKTDAFMDRTKMKLQNHDATLKSLETQVGQISQILNTRPIGRFPSDTEPTINKNGTAANPSAATDAPAEANESAAIDEDHNDPPNISKGEFSAKSSHTRPDKLEEEKKWIEEFETAAATGICLALMHNKIPAKKADPGSFTIECSIGHNYSNKAVCDPGASTNLMPKSVFKKLGIREAKPTTVMLQLADHSFVQPEGKIEDILVRIDKFIFPVDFLILLCEADENAPIILGRPFLSTSRSTIDFDKD
ncbi:hypothetical protein V6N11_046733 [Hibiscus sabdariffa]|uniref:Uncharacterized protein n=1 Tax=Hibiscus sabdariffa TaxID=183260 RepID=A0ABR2NGE6_9ROSI